MCILYIMCLCLSIYPFFLFYAKVDANLNIETGLRCLGCEQPKMSTIALTCGNSARLFNSFPSKPIELSNLDSCPISSILFRCVSTVVWLTPSPAAICLKAKNSTKKVLKSVNKKSGAVSSSAHSTGEIHQFIPL